MPKVPNGSKGDWNPGSLGCKSGVLPLSYRARHDTFITKTSVTNMAVTNISVTSMMVITTHPENL